MAGSTWAQRAKTLNEAGYARYDERTSAMLGDTAAGAARLPAQAAGTGHPT